MADTANPTASDPNDFTDPSPNPGEDGQLAVLCSALQQKVITRVVVHYEGSGDSGGVSEVEYEPEGTAVPEELADRIREVAEEYCPDGYEDNEGGYGSLTVYPSAGLAQPEYTARDITTEAVDFRALRLPRRLRRRLTELGVLGVTASFDGHSDSGQIEEFSLEPENTVLGGKLETKLEHFLFSHLPGDWADNEGGFGSFTVDVVAGTVAVEAYWWILSDSPTNSIRWIWRQ